MADLFSSDASPAPPQEQDESGSLAVSQTTPRRGGHGPQPSVGNAASLFGGSGDDPFASITSPATPKKAPTPLVSLAEEAAEGDPADAAASLFGGSADGAPTSDDLFGAAASPADGSQTDNGRLGVPSLTTPASSGSSGPPSPSKLFTSTSGYDDDWLGGTKVDTTQAPVTLDASITANDPQVADDGVEGQAGYGQHDQYGAQADGYGEQAGQGYAEHGYYGDQSYDAQQQQQYGDQSYAYDYSQPQQQQQYDGQYDYAPQQYDQQQQQHYQYDQQQYDYGAQGAAATYDQTQQLPYGQEYAGQHDQHQQHDYQAHDAQHAGYGGYDASAYGQSGEAAYDPQQANYASYDSAMSRASYDGAAYDSTGTDGYGYAPQQSSGQAADNQGYWQEQAQLNDGYRAEATAVAADYGSSYSADQTNQGAYDYSHTNATAIAPPPPTAATLARVPSPYDPVPAPSVPASTMPNSQARAASPYEPATPVSPAMGAGTLSSVPPPPVAGPPRGPPRGPARRSPKPASPVSAPAIEPVAAAPEDATAAVPAASDGDGYSWGMDEAQHGGEDGGIDVQQQNAGADAAWEGGEAPSAFGQQAYGWVNQLEDAAATPPAVEDGPAPPMLTVTDEDATASVVYHPDGVENHFGEDADAQLQAQEPMQLQDPELVDQAVDALQELDLNGQEHIDEGLEESVAAGGIAGEEAELARHGEAEMVAPPEGGETQDSSSYGGAYEAEDDQAATGNAEDGQYAPQKDGPAQGSQPAGPGQAYGLDTEQVAQDAAADPYAPRAAGHASNDPYSPAGVTDGTYGGYQQSQWGDQGSSEPEQSQQPQQQPGQPGQPDNGFAAYGQSPYDPYAPSHGGFTSDYNASHHQPNGYGSHPSADDTYGSYAPYGGSADPYAPSHDGQQQHERQLSDSRPYDNEDDADDARTPHATTGRPPWSDASSPAVEAYASPYGAPASQGLKRAGTVTQRSIDATGGGGDGYRAPYDSADSYAAPHGRADHGAADRQPSTPGAGGNGESGNYFDGGAHYASPSHSSGFAGGVGAAPASPYDPGKAARSYASEASYPSSISGSGVDMQEQMRNAKIPIVSFGFGGQLVMYFPTASSSDQTGASDGGYGGYGYMGGSGAPTSVTIQPLSAVIPSSSYATAFDPLHFPGPAFEGASATALSRATGGANAGAKAKKAALIKHLDEKIGEVEAGIGYLRRRPSFSASGDVDHEASLASRGTNSQLECQRAEDKVALLKLLRLILVHDAQTTNNPAFDAAVRELLTGEKADDSSGGSARFAPASPFGAAAPSASSGETLRTYELKRGFLETLQSMLLRGERREAVALAVEQKMWAHAMTIASCVDKDCWRTVVADFIEDELGAGVGLSASSGQTSADLQTLKVAYNVFSGQDPVSVFDLFRPKKQMLLDASQPSDAVSPGSGAAAPTSLPDWKGSVAIVLSNKSINDSAALTAIGDGLAVHGLVEAAHFCYALAPATSPFGGVDVSAVRMTLLGCQSPKVSAHYLQDLDGIILTEILEFAQSLMPITKGQDAYAGIPHLQAYRLVHAYRLAELGDVQRAQKYCEAIAGALKLSKNSPYLHGTLLSQLKELSDRLVGAPQVNGSGNWMTRKMQRPTLDGVWGALEGRFTKFIAGEENEATASPSRSKSLGPGVGASGGAGGSGNGDGPVGPFSHYTAITPDAAAGGMSRQQSFVDLNAPPSMPQSRAGSAMDFHHNRRAASPKHRASSAMAVRHSPRDPYHAWPQPLSQMPSGDRDQPSAGHAFEASRNGHVLQTSEYSSYEPRDSFQSSRPSDQDGWQGSDSRRQSVDTYDQGSQQDRFDDRSESYRGYSAYKEQDAGEGYGAAHDDVPYYGYQPHGAQQPQFVSNVDGPSLESAEDGGFVSPMDALAGAGAGAGRNSRTPQPQSQPDYSQNRSSNAYHEEDDEDDDLGLGNSSSKKKQAHSSEGDSRGGHGAASSYEPAPAAAKEADADQDKKESNEDKPGLKPSASSSWLGRLWGRSSSTTLAEQAKAKKAHLGEETAFYYDKELKRWVNKKAGDTSTPASPPPPPPRAQTTSPATGPDRGAGAASAPPMRNFSGGPPPPRSALSGFSGRATPPISEEQSGPPGAGLPLRNGGPGLARARSNLADHTMPPAAQPPTRSGSATPMGGPSAMSPPPAPPPGSRAGTVKKRPIKSRYVVVD
ncbi:uncharacterized protein PFL1_03807 [Pseudozyma flocculosa PF-1]|uniref:Protein transport protein sec16 n=2 Tax=Pseudozyma flocculosa TaxID=84751 RepID=A0A5C3EXB5_9BASI|nr:uncharacterized protein PFL1_03807 [Pseudozyma flocculosa PF-1]EPQ28504.1 hypothetical protein PFL1_03807 [Pseudozyma flocculosa PF-1]SPO36425.1 uncharacterized protein PSFLO_01896 [Pseudozyma flocculosa]